MVQITLDIIQENAELKAEVALLKSQIAELQTQKKDFDEYEVINAQIQRSGIQRIDWKVIFSETLTKIVAEYYARGRSATETYEELRAKLERMQITNPELLRRLKIGVCARHGEIRSEQGRIRDVRHELDKNKHIWRKV